MVQQLIEAELSATIAAGPPERTDARTAQRNGHRPKLVTTAAGDIELQIPKLPTGSFFPSLLERRRRIDRALSAVVSRRSRDIDVLAVEVDGTPDCDEA